MPRDYKDTLIEDLIDRELAFRLMGRIERSALLDRIDQQRAEITRLQSRLDAVTSELARYTRTAVSPAARRRAGGALCRADVSKATADGTNPSGERVM